MPAPIRPAEVFHRAAEEGRRRLDQSLLELAATGFIAGFTIVLGVVGLGVVEGMAKAQLAEFARLPGAILFAFGVVFLIVGRAELFTENFFDPIASAADFGGWRKAPRLFRLWAVTLALNLIGAFVLVWVMSAPGALPISGAEALNHIAEEAVGRTGLATLSRAVLGGTLVALLSFLVASADSATGRMLVAFMVGVLLPLGPFEHVVVTAAHLSFGLLLGADLALDAAGATLGWTLVGNLLGGVGLVTLSHVAQAKGAEN